jgi:hypothetical protein
MENERKPRLVETLVSWVYPQVMISMGKIMNPITQKTERDLPQARALIDLLAELEEKTRGNLEDDERRLLQKSLTELRLNYLDEINRPAEQASGEGPGAGDIGPGPAEGGEKTSDRPA